MKTFFKTGAVLGFATAFATVGVAPASASPPETVTLSATGSGQALTIDIYDPNAEPRMYNVPLPFSRTVNKAVNSGDLFQIVAVPKGTAQPGCSIAVNGKVVASEPDGGSGHCIFTAP
jgi:hypothetical protein